MIQFIVEHVLFFVAAWFTFSFLGLWIHLQTQKYIQVHDVIWAVMFGPFYFLTMVSDLDAIVIDLRKRKDAMTDKLKLKGLPEPNRSIVERSGAEIDRFKKEHTCAMCGCLINEDKGWLARRDFTCELCRLEYQDAFE